MKDEIKEVLDYLKSDNWRIGNGDYKKVLYKYEVDCLLDCITNLQEENKELSLELSGYREAILRDDKLLGLQEENERLRKEIELCKKNGNL